MAARSAKLDSTPIAGFDQEILDREFDLAAQGLRSVVLLSLGHHSKDDFNADLKKARLPMADVVQIIE